MKKGALLIVARMLNKIYEPGRFNEINRWGDPVEPVSLADMHGWIEELYQIERLITMGADITLDHILRTTEEYVRENNQEVTGPWCWRMYELKNLQAALGWEWPIRQGDFIKFNYMPAEEYMVTGTDEDWYGISIRVKNTDIRSPEHPFVAVYSWEDLENLPFEVQ